MRLICGIQLFMSKTMLSGRTIPIPPKEQQEKFYNLVGKVTLIHAGIEQDLKGVLIEDWKIPENQVEKLYGKNLRKDFLKNIKACQIQETYYTAYSNLMNRFEDASEKRNDIIKATYGYLEPAGKIFRYDLKIQRSCHPEMKFNDGREKEWMKIVTFEELENLASELSRVREYIFQLSRKIYLEKIMHDGSKKTN